MDIQLKRGLLEICVLAAIKGEESYGYQIIKDVKPYVELSESTLYTILKRLETANMLTVRIAEHGGSLLCNFANEVNAERHIGAEENGDFFGSGF